MPTEGQTAINKRTGETAVFTNGVWVATGQKGQQADANLRGRSAIGLGPMVQAEQTMEAAERDGNPLNRDWGATLLDNLGFSALGMDVHPLRPLAKAIGGQDYQDYTQAAKAIEAQIMPIQSGAAVSPSEAERQRKAALPELGDSKETLARKAATRRMMLNGLAKTTGGALPYPDTPTFGVNTRQLPQAAGAQPAPPPQQRQPGMTYQTPKGPMKWTGTGWLPQ